MLPHIVALSIVWFLIEKILITSIIEVEARINKHKGAFDVACVSLKPPKDIVGEVLEALEKQSLKYKKVIEAVAIF